MQPVPGIGVELICSQVLHVGFRFAAFLFLLLYKQYPTALPAGSADGILAFQVRVTLWCPVTDDGCNVATPAGGHRSDFGSPEAKRDAFALDVFADCKLALESALTQRLVAATRNPYTAMMTATHSTSRDIKIREDGVPGFLSKELPDR
jgi:hypothetical protein